MNFWDDEDAEEARLAEAKAKLIVHRLKLPGELVRALHYLLEKTVDMSLRYSVGMTPGEERARTVALAALERAVNFQVEGKAITS